MTNRPIRIQIDAKVKGMDEKHVEVDCDDYILLYSKVNGAAFDPEGNKEKATAIVKTLTDKYPLYE